MQQRLVVAVCVAALVLPSEGFLQVVPGSTSLARTPLLARAVRPRLCCNTGRTSVRPDASGMRGLRAASGEEEVDLEAFRDLLNDSWATQTAKSDDGVGLLFGHLLCRHIPSLSHSLARSQINLWIKRMHAHEHISAK